MSFCYTDFSFRKLIFYCDSMWFPFPPFSFYSRRDDRAAAQKCPPLAMAIALDIRKGISHESSTFIEFPVVEIASAIGWNSGVVKYQLKQLEWTTGLLDLIESNDFIPNAEQNSEVFSSSHRFSKWPTKTIEHFGRIFGSWIPCFGSG